MIQILDNLKVPEFTDETTCDDPGCACHNDNLDLPSAFQIGENIRYRKQYDTDHGFNRFGMITAVRFTLAKVFYDILDDEGFLVSNVDSDNITIDE